MKIFILVSILLAAVLGYNYFMSTEEFVGKLVEGKTYMAHWPVESLNVEMNHAYSISFVNLGEFEELRGGQGEGKQVTFEVTSKKIYKVEGEDRWNEEYELKILKVE